MKIFKLKTYLIICLLLNTQFGISQKIHGKVLSYNNSENVIGAWIKTNIKEYYTITDIDGAFQLSINGNELVNTIFITYNKGRHKTVVLKNFKSAINNDFLDVGEIILPRGKKKEKYTIDFAKKESLKKNSQNSKITKTSENSIIDFRVDKKEVNTNQTKASQLRGLSLLSSFDFYESGNFRTLKSEINNIDIKHKSTAKIYSAYHKKYINCTWYGDVINGYANGEGIGVFTFESCDVFFIGNTMEGDLNGHGKYILRQIHKGNFLYLEKATHEGPMSIIIEGNFKKNVQEGVFLNRRALPNDGYMTRNNKWVTHYLTIVGNYKHGEFTKGVAYISESHSLDSFGVEGYKCSYDHRHNYIRCEMDYATPIGKLERDKELKTALGVVGALALLKGGYNAMKSAMDYQSTDTYEKKDLPCYSKSAWTNYVTYGFSTNNKTQVIKCNSNNREKKLMYIGDDRMYDVSKDNSWTNIRNYEEAVRQVLKEIDCNCNY